MPNHIAYVGSSEVSIDSERPIVCALVGQLDEEAECPKELMQYRGILRMGTKPEGYVPMTKEQEVLLSTFDRDVRRGKFNPKVLSWYESEAEAEADRINWPKHINFRLVPVQAKL